VAAHASLFLAAGLGALAQEAFHWYNRREKLHIKENQQLMRSVPYW
jgi:hypothetical protein